MTFQQAGKTSRLLNYFNCSKTSPFFINFIYAIFFLKKMKMLFAANKLKF
jgi:hypothetical protein